MYKSGFNSSNSQNIRKFMERSQYLHIQQQLIMIQDNKKAHPDHTNLKLNIDYIEAASLSYSSLNTGISGSSSYLYN